MKWQGASSGLETRLIGRTIQLSREQTTEAESPVQIEGLPRAEFYPALCCAAVLTCILAAWPFANSAFNDDWSYTRVALLLAESGHLHYNGWGGATILLQAVWGAAWIRLFDFSFNILRIATIPFSLGFVLLVYALARKSELSPRDALFAALTVGTSPLFLPLAASFMTDAYACFFAIGCIYAAIASAQIPAEEPRARTWLWVLTLSGILGGSDRQIVFAAPLVLIPYLLWLKRSNRRFQLQATMAYLLCLTSLAVLAIRFSQPYAPLALTRQQVTSLMIQNGPMAVLWVVNALLSCLLVCLPALLCAIPVRRMRSYHILWCVAGATASTISLAAVFGIQYGLVPFLGNILSTPGILGQSESALSLRPPIFPTIVRCGFTWFLLFSLAVFACTCRNRRSTCTSVSTLVFGLFSFAYVLLLMPGALTGITFDRYTLPLLPLAVISILRSRPRGRVIPVSAWACVVVFAGYGIATTHDYFSDLRARETTSKELENSGVARSRISVGFEHDGWLQVELAGTIKPFMYGDDPRTKPGEFWFWKRATALTPEYVVLSAPIGKIPSHPMASIPFHTWLPPFRRAAVGIRRADFRTDLLPRY